MLCIYFYHQHQDPSFKSLLSHLNGPLGGYIIIGVIIGFIINVIIIITISTQIIVLNCLCHI